MDLPADERPDRDELGERAAFSDEIGGLDRPQQRPARRAAERALLVALARLGGAREELGELSVPERSADASGGSTHRAPSSVRARALGRVAVAARSGPI